MSLAADTMVDRRRLKRRLALWQTFAVLVLVALGIVFVRALDTETVPGLGRDHIARITVSDVIVRDRWLEERIDELIESRRVRAVIVSIDSPGGTVVGGESLYHALDRLAAAKPVVAVMGTTATSAAYMAALPAERIFAHAGTVTGSIGVIAQIPEFTELLGKLGVHIEEVRSAELKGRPSPFEPMTERAREETERLIADMLDMFVDMVAAKRALDHADVRRLADGRVYTGREAKDQGLIDEVGGEREARRWLELEHRLPSGIRVVDVRRPAGSALRDAVGSILPGHGLVPRRLALDGLLAIWHPDL